MVSTIGSGWESIGWEACTWKLANGDSTSYLSTVYFLKFMLLMTLTNLDWHRQHFFVRYIQGTILSSYIHDVVDILIMQTVCYVLSFLFLLKMITICLP